MSARGLQQEGLKGPCEIKAPFYDEACTGEKLLGVQSELSRIGTIDTKERGSSNQGGRVVREGMEAALAPSAEPGLHPSSGCVFGKDRVCFGTERRRREFRRQHWSCRVPEPWRQRGGGREPGAPPQPEPAASAPDSSPSTGHQLRSGRGGAGDAALGESLPRSQEPRPRRRAERDKVLFGEDVCRSRSQV